MLLLQQIDAPIAYLSFSSVFKAIDSIDKLVDFVQILF
jgi:transcriptional regulator NrdR family protein